MVNNLLFKLLMAIVKRPISFIAAAVSCRRPVIGPLIKGTGAIPV
jgi:1-acyl-sn-glycerol-3-phosphate acyltransferase